jgi:hypothetical protein
MTHTICTADTREELTYFQRLWRTLLAPNIDSKTKLEQLFEHETADFDLEYAFLSSIDLEDETERFDVVHGSHERLQPGTTVPLSETYCRRTIADPEGTLAVSDARAEGWEDDPAYAKYGIGSYLGTTVSVEDDLYGTLCFASTAPREDQIRDEEIALVDMHGQWVAYTLSLWDGPPVRDRGVDTIEERSVSSDDIDSMMDALGTQTRRDILTTLVGNTTEVSLTTLERVVDQENPRTRLRHVDLPRLANAGYITWDGDSGTIAEGPRFSEVEPLADLLREYNREFPD